MQRTATYLMRGGLNLVTPAVAMTPGQCIGALNYESDVPGYRRISGYERFDGQPSPSEGADADEAEARRALIGEVPGSGPVRGVCVYGGTVYAFRDTVGGDAKMYKATDAGWEEQTGFGYQIYFTSGSAEFLEGETLAGFTSGATARIDRVVLQSGAWSGTAAGYLVISNISGTFQAETGTSTSGSATIGTLVPIQIPGSGKYDFVVHNFYGPLKSRRMYFANGSGNAFEWDGEVLAPIKVGNTAGTFDELVFLLNDAGDNLTNDAGATLVLSGDFDRPTRIAQYSNHLFLSYRAGSVINSGVGEPLDYRAAAGAAEFSFGSPVTGFFPIVASALVIAGENRIAYLTGEDSSNFNLQIISDRSGAAAWSVSAYANQPIYVDDAGIRKLETTEAFGDWRMGTISQPIDPLLRRKRDSGVRPVASLSVRNKDQYRLFLSDGSGVSTYMNIEMPESMPFMLPIEVFCACSGEVIEGEGERYFVGAQDGYVYELDKGKSFDGAEIAAYLRLAFANLTAPAQDKRYHKATFEIDAPSAMTIGASFHVDYAIPNNLGGAQQDISVSAGSLSLIPFGEYDSIDWTQPTEGLLEVYLDGIGRNAAITLVSEHTTEEPHTISSMTINYSPRRVLR